MKSKMKVTLKALRYRLKI